MADPELIRVLDDARLAQGSWAFVCLACGITAESLYGAVFSFTFMAYTAHLTVRTHRELTKQRLAFRHGGDHG